MAISATAPSALPDLSWDETIVPALRKRLESESRAISKRMSTASITSADDGIPPYSHVNVMRTSTPNTKKGGRFTPSSTDRPSAIPRPSLNYSRPHVDSSNNTTWRSDDKPVKPPAKRSRTFSQPYVFGLALTSDANGPNGHKNSSTTRTANALPTPASSRSNSPAIPCAKPSDVRPTRIPKASSSNRVDGSSRTDGRITPSSSHHMQLQNTFLPPENTLQDWEAYENEPYASSQSSVNVPVPRPAKPNGIMHEAPPFSVDSSMVSDVEPVMIRPSIEEERPFEHWYRGDLSRNGGVGELRVGNRMEMLEIANFGHKLRHLANGSMARRRRRAESIGNRESVIFDEYNSCERGPMVLDETPLTDMEADTEFETDRELSFTKSHLKPLERPKRMVVNELTSSSVQLATAPIQTTRQESQIPRAMPVAAKAAHRAVSEPLSASTSSITPLRALSPASKSTIPHPHSQAVASPAQKRGRTKSPAAVPSGKKLKAAVVSPQKQYKLSLDERLRSREVAEYPEMPDVPGGMADAIPSWTQPKKSGNWDEVVLPVVARKMGLEDQYEEADGSPNPPRPPSQEVIPPQPGTFGIDDSKRRRNRYHPVTGEVIPMDEFEEMPSTVEEGPSREEGPPERLKRLSEATTPAKPQPLHIDANTQKPRPYNRYSTPSSPAPFAQYARQTGDAKLDNVDQVMVVDESHGGCCGCVVM